MTIPLRPSNASKRSVGMSFPSHAFPQHTLREQLPVKSTSRRRSGPEKSKTISISKNPMRGNQHKASWTPEQDAILLKLLQENGGTGRWRIVAESFQSETGVVGRGAKHCRERYFNHLDPNINHSEWTEEEDSILTAAYAEHGTAWSKIAKFLPGRTDNAIKNRWYCKQRKQSRKARTSSSSSSSCSSSPRGPNRFRSTIAEAATQLEMMTSSDESCSERKCRKRPIASTRGNRPRSMTCYEDDQEEVEEPLTVKRLSLDETNDSLRRRQLFVDQQDDNDDDENCTSTSSEQEGDLDHKDDDVRESNDYYDSPVPELQSNSTTFLSCPDSYRLFTQPQQHQSLQRPDSFLSSLSFPAAFTTTSSSSKSLGASFYWSKLSRSSSFIGHPSVESTELSAGRRSPLQQQSSMTEIRSPSLHRPASLVTMLGPSMSSYDLYLLLDTISFNDQ